MLIIGETFAAGAGEGCGCGVGWLVAMRPCDEDDNDGGVVADDVDSTWDVSTDVSDKWDVAAVDDDGEEVAADFTKWSALLFFAGGASSVS